MYKHYIESSGVKTVRLPGFEGTSGAGLQEAGLLSGRCSYIFSKQERT